MKEGADDKSDVTVRQSAVTPVEQSAQCTGGVPKTLKEQLFFTADPAFSNCCQLFCFFLVICSDIHSGEFHVYPSLEKAPAATHLLTFNARNNSSLFSPLWLQKCLFLASEESLLSPFRVHDSRESSGQKTVIFSLARTSFPFLIGKAAPSSSSVVQIFHCSTSFSLIHRFLIKQSSSPD